MDNDDLIDNVYVKCPTCASKSWTIYMHKISCCRCGLSYSTPNISFLKTNVISGTIPSSEVIKALEILDGPEK